jgi:hypothetical protein
MKDDAVDLGWYAIRTPAHSSYTPHRCALRRYSYKASMLDLQRNYTNTPHTPAYFSCNLLCVSDAMQRIITHSWCRLTPFSLLSLLSLLSLSPPSLLFCLLLCFYLLYFSLLMSLSCMSLCMSPSVCLCRDRPVSSLDPRVSFWSTPFRERGLWMCGLCTHRPAGGACSSVTRRRRSSTDTLLMQL